VWQRHPGDEDGIDRRKIPTSTILTILSASLIATTPRSWILVTGIPSQVKDIRPPVRSNGRTYKMLVMFLFFQRVISEILRPITVKLCNMIGNWSYFIIQVPKFGGLSPKKICGQKHAKFRSILHNLRLWSRISPERLKISKIWKLMFQFDSSCVLWKKSGELWSTNYRDLDVSLDPLKCTYLGYYISALKGCCALKFLHALEIDQALVAYTQRRTGVPPQKF